MKYSRKQLQKVEKDSEDGVFPMDNDLWFAYLEWKQNKIYRNLFIMLTIAATLFLLP